MSKRTHTTEWNLEVGSGKEAVEQLLKLFEILRGYVDKDLLRQALNVESEHARLVAVTKLIKDAIETEKQLAKARGESYDSIIAKQENLKSSVTSYLGAASKATKIGHFEQLSSSLRTANIEMSKLGVVLQGPIRSGSAGVDQLRSTLEHLADTTGRLSDAPLLSPISAKHIMAVGDAAKHVLETMDRIERKTSGISSKDLFKGKGALSVDDAGADKLVRMFEKTTEYWTRNEQKVEETYRKALEGEANAQKQIIRRTRKMNGLVEAAERFRDAAKQGIIPESYVSRMENILNILLSSDSVLGRIRTGSQDMMKKLSDPAASSQLQKVLYTAQEITAELSSPKLSQGAKDYQNRIEEAITRVSAKLKLQQKDAIELWKQSNDQVKSWQHAYSTAIDEIDTRRKAMEAGTTDTHKIEKIIGREEVKAAEEYLRVLFKQQKNLRDIVNSVEAYANALRKQAGSSALARKELQHTEDILSKMKGSLGVISSEISTVGAKSKTAFDSMKKGSAGTARTFRGLNQDVKDFAYFMDIAIQKIIRYRVAFTALHEIVRFFKSTLEVPKELEHQFAQLKKVMDESTTDFKALKNSAIGFAIDYGTSIKDVSDIMFVWAQQGKNQQEILELTRTTLLGVTAANLTAKQSVEALTAAIKQFDISAEDSAIVIDKLLNVQKNFAVTAQDLADSIKLLGATAETLGIDINGLFGQVAAVAEITRKSGKAVANSLKTIFARIVKKDAIDAIQRIGVALYDTEGSLRPLGDVLDDIASKWSTLTKSEQIHISHVVGGIRRYNDFLVLMKNYGTSLRGTAISLQSEGAAAKAAEIETQTLQRAVESAKVGFEKFTDSVGRNTFGFAKLGYAYKGLSSTLVNDQGTLTTFGKTVSGLTAGLGALVLSLVAVKGTAFALQLGLRSLVNVANANKIASLSVRSETEGLTIAQARAALATEHHVKEQIALLSMLDQGYRIRIKLAGGNLLVAGSDDIMTTATDKNTIALAKNEIIKKAAEMSNYKLAISTNVAKTAIFGFLKAVGVWGAVFTLLSLGLTAILIKRGKDKQQLEEHKEATHQSVLESTKLLEVFKKSQGAIKVHTNQLVHMATALKSGALLPTEQLEQFDKFLLQINQHLSVFGKSPIAPHVWTDNQISNVKQMDEAIGRVLIKLQEIDGEVDRFNKQTVENLNKAIELEIKRQAFLGKYQVGLSDVNDSFDGMLSSTKEVVKNVAELGNVGLTRKVLSNMEDIFEKISNGEEWSEAWLDGLKKSVENTDAEVAVDKWGSLLSSFAAKYAKTSGMVANSIFKDEFSKGLEDAYKKKGESLLVFLRNMSKKAKEYMILSDIKHGFDIEDDMTMRAQVYILDSLRNSNNLVTGSLIDMSSALEESSDVQQLFIGLLNELSNGFDTSRGKTKDLTAQLVETAKVYNVILFSEEDFTKRINESVVAMDKARIMMRGYIGVLNEKKEVVRGSLDLDLEHNRTLGDLTSSYEVHRKGLAKTLKVARDSYLLQLAKLEEYEREELTADNVSKAFASTHEIMQNGIKERIVTLREESEKWQNMAGDHEDSIKKAKLQIEGLQNILEGFATAAATGKFEIPGVTKEEEFKVIVGYLKDVLGFSQEIAEQDAKKLQDSRDGNVILDLRLDILKNEVKLRYAEYQKIKNTLMLEKARVDLAEKSYKQFWYNINTQQKLTTGYYQELEKLSSKLGSMYNEQKTGLSLINVDMKAQENAIKVIEKIIGSQMNTLEKVKVDWNSIGIHVNMTREEIEQMAKLLGVKKEAISDIVDLAENELLIIDKETEQAKKLLLIKKNMSAIDEGLTRAYQTRLDMSQKYYSELTNLQRSAGMNEKDIIDTEIAGIKKQIELRHDEQRSLSGTIDSLQGISVTSLAIGEAISKSAMDMDDAADHAKIKWLEVQKKLVDVKQTLEDMADITSRVAELISGVIFDATKNMIDNFEESKNIQEEILEQQKSITDLQRQYSEATDPEQQREIADNLTDANKELTILRDKSEELRSLWYNIKQLAKDFAQGITDIIVEINQDQLKRALEEIIVNSSFGGSMANVMSGGLVKGSTIGSDLYYKRILDGARDGADKMYWAIVNAIRNSAKEFSIILGEAQKEALIMSQISGRSASVGAGRLAEHANDIAAEETEASNTNVVISIEKLININTRLVSTLETLTSAVNNQTIKTSIGTDVMDETKDIDARFSNNMSATERAINALTLQLSTMAGTYIGGGGQGANIGATMLGAIGLETFGPIGAAIGGIVGGFFGGKLFDSGGSKTEYTPQMTKPSLLATEDNTSAIESNTITLTKLNIAMNDIRQEMINAPSRFTLPASVGGGAFGGGGLNVSIKVDGSMTPGVARQVTNDINDIYNNQYRRQGDTARLT